VPPLAEQQVLGRELQEHQVGDVPLERVEPAVTVL
jgi:hypothetical protein